MGTFRVKCLFAAHFFLLSCPPGSWILQRYQEQDRSSRFRQRPELRAGDPTLFRLGHTALSLSKTLFESLWGFCACPCVRAHSHMCTCVYRYACLYGHECVCVCAHSCMHTCVCGYICLCRHAWNRSRCQDIFLNCFFMGFFLWFFFFIC